MTTTTTTTETLWERLEDDAKAALAWLENFLSTVIESEVKALEPIALQAVTQVAAILPSLAAKGGGTSFAAAASLALTQAASAAASAGLNVASSSLQAAVASAIANAQATSTDPAVMASNTLTGNS